MSESIRLGIILALSGGFMFDIEGSPAVRQIVVHDDIYYNGKTF